MGDSDGARGQHASGNDSGDDRDHSLDHGSRADGSGESPGNEELGLKDSRAVSTGGGHAESSGGNGGGVRKGGEDVGGGVGGGGEDGRKVDFEGPDFDAADSNGGSMLEVSET